MVRYCKKNTVSVPLLIAGGFLDAAQSGSEWHGQQIEAGDPLVHYQSDEWEKITVDG